MAASMEKRAVTTKFDPGAQESTAKPLLRLSVLGFSTSQSNRAKYGRLLFIMVLLYGTWALLALAFGAPSWRTSRQQQPALPDLALQHVLDDGSQIFGVYSPAAPNQQPGSSSSKDRSAWMSRYPDSTPLTHLTIPGAHDAATWNFSLATRDSLPPNVGTRDPAYLRTQRASIAAALTAGVRFFDLRYALDPTGTALVFWHREALLSEVARVADVMFAFYAWLDAHATETVLLSFQFEGDRGPGGDDKQTTTVQRLLLDVLMGPAARRYVLQTRDELGTLGPARGKVVLLRRFDVDVDLSREEEAALLPGIHLSPALWPHNRYPDFELVYNPDKGLAAYVEDYYEPGAGLGPGLSNASANIARKLDAATAHLRKAAQEGGERQREGLFITFASGENNDNTPPVFPEIMAVGNGTAYTPLGGVNQQLLPVLRELRGERLGVVVVDFWDEPAGLVDAILGL